MKIKNIQLKYSEEDNFFQKNNGIRFIKNGLPHRNYELPYRIDKDNYKCYRIKDKSHKKLNSFTSVIMINNMWTDKINKEQGYYYGRFYDKNYDETYEKLKELKLI